MEQISAQNTFLFYLLLAKSGTDFCRMKRLKTHFKIGHRFVQIGPRFWHFKTPILSHYNNILHIDSKLVMMQFWPSTTLLLSPCFIFPCFQLHQVIPQASTQSLQPWECLPPSWRTSLHPTTLGILGSSTSLHHNLFNHRNAFRLLEDPLAFNYPWSFLVIP